jgi:hypothetical protein
MAWQVQKANLYTTRAIARMLLMCDPTVIPLRRSLRLSNCREEVRMSAGPPVSAGRRGIESVLGASGIGRDTMQSNIADLLHALTRYVIPSHTQLHADACSIPIEAVS